MFHVRRRPADCQPRRRKKKSGSLRAAGGHGGAGAGLLLESQPDGTLLDNGRSVRLGGDVVEVGSANGVALQLYGPSIQPRHCVVATSEGVVTLTPLHADAHTYVNGQRIYHTTILQHGCLIKFGRMATFRFVDPAQENKLNRNLSQSQHFDSGSVYDRSPTSPVPDNISGMMSPVSQSMHSQLDGMQSSIDPSGSNIGGSDFQRAMSPILGNNKMGSQDNFALSYNGKSLTDSSDAMSGYNNNNNNNVKMDGESLILSQHLANSKADLLQENHFASPYNGIGSPQNMGGKDQGSGNKNANNQYKDNYETTFDLDGNVETKSICSAKSGGSGHENRISRGQEAILPAVLEFPEHCQQLFLQSVISGLDVNVPAFKLAPVYTLYLCARYRASTHYRPELSPTERAHKLTALLHHIATLIQNTVQEKYADAAVQAFWMANSSELLHFLKCDRHISAFSIQAQDILAHTVQVAFSNLVGCFHVELSHVLSQFLDEQQTSEAAGALVLGALGAAMALLRKCRVNAALTIQLFSQLFHYINVWCFNKVVTMPHMWCAIWGALVSARLAPIGAWAERQGLELAADCHLALIHQCAHLLQAPKSTPDDIANLTSTCFKLNSVQLRCLLGGFSEDPSGGGGPGLQRLQPDLVESAVKHAQGVADELHRADGREITLEESSTLPLSLLIPEDGFSADVVRGLPSGLAEFLAPLQRAALCRLAPQPHSQGHWTVYMNGYLGGSMAVRPPQQPPVVQVIKLQKNSNGMGLSIVAAKGAGQSRLGIYIKSVVAGGAAAADQRLQAGDQLLSVDGHSLVGITQERAAEHLVRTGPLVTLEVAKQGAVLHGLATLLRQPSPQSSRETERRNSGTFTNTKPAYLRRMRPESEMITANIHPAENSYAIRCGLIEGDNSMGRFPSTSGGLIKNSAMQKRNLVLLKENSFKSSSEESLDNTVPCPIPRVIINFDGEEFEESPDFDGELVKRVPVVPTPTVSMPVLNIPPTFSFTDFDEICSSEMRNACENLKQYEDSTRHNNNMCCREQSVDSSNQSCDSDCSFPDCTRKNGTPTHCSCREESKTNDSKIDFDTSKEQSLCRSFQIIDERLSNSIDQLHSFEICREEDENEEIPYIDDIDSEPLIFEHKSCSKEDICQDTHPKLNIRSLFSDSSLSKKLCDVGTNVKFDSLTLNCSQETMERDQTSQSKKPVGRQSSYELQERDFLRDTPEKNYFLENISDTKSGNSSKVHYININIDKFNSNTDCKDIEYNDNLSKSFGAEDMTDSNICCDYNILESSDDNSPDTKNDISSSSTERVYTINSRKSSRHSKMKLDFSTLNTDSESSSSEFVNRSKQKITLNKSVSKSNELLNDDDDKCWKSPDDIRLGFGKVKALAKHFNSMNLIYQSRSYKRNCQSSPNLFQNNNMAKTNLLGKSVISASLLNVTGDIEADDDKQKAHTEDEQRRILIQLEDWSKYGTMGNSDDNKSEECLSQKAVSVDDKSPLAKIIFKEIINTTPRLITLDKINIRNTTPNIHQDDVKSPLNKKFGSLEKLTGSLVPRVIEMIPRKTISTPNVHKDIIKEKKPAIEKTKLILPRKKFPQSYIVKKKSSVLTDSDICNQINHNTTRKIIQSCPNLLNNNNNRRHHCVLGVNLHNSCPNLIRNSSQNLCNMLGPSYMRICRIRNVNSEMKERPPTPRYAWIQYGPRKMIIKKSLSYENISPRRMSERDLPSKLEMEHSSGGGHMANTVKSSKSVPALHEHTKQHEVFNPGYSRTSSNNSIPAMAGLKSKAGHGLPQAPAQIDQNSFYQNLSVYRNSGLGDRSSTLRNSQNGLQLQGHSPQLKDATGQSASERLSLPPVGQRPQSAYYGQPVPSPGQSPAGLRTAQSTKDLAYNNENHPQNQVRGGYPSMPNVNQAYNANQAYGQMPGNYPPNTTTYNRAPMSPNQYNNQNQFNNQGPNVNQYNNQALPGTQHGSQAGNINQYGNQPGMNQYGSQTMPSNPNLRGQAKLAEMSEEVTRRQQRGPLSPHGDPNILSPMQQNRFGYGNEYVGHNGPMSPNAPMSPTKQQPPVAPKPQGMKRGVSGEMLSQDIVEGPPLPPTATHPLYHPQQGPQEDGSYSASNSDPPAVSFYPTQRSGQNPQNAAPNPWEREEREKELEGRRLAARVWRDKQIAALQALGEDRRTPQQEQQLRALTLERDFQRRAQEAQTEEDDKEAVADGRTPSVPPHGGLLRVAGNGASGSSAQDLNLVPVASNIVSSIQPVSVATSNTNGGEQQQDNQSSQQQDRVASQLPPPPPVQPKSILKSNLRLDNLNSNSPQSPSKSQKNASFSSNLTPQTLKFDNVPKYDVNSKYDHNVNNKYDANIMSKYESNQPKYPDQVHTSGGKYEQHITYSTNTTSQNIQNMPNNVISPNQLSQNMSNLNMNTPPNYNNVDSNQRYDNQQYGQQNYNSAPPPPERGSSFAIMSQQQALRSNVSTSSQMSVINSNIMSNQALKDKRVSFHDNDQALSVTMTDMDSQENEMEQHIREDPDRFILEAESMLQSPTSPTGTNVTHTPGVIGAQEVYRDPRQRRLAEQQKAQLAGSTPIPEKLSFKEKMKMFALESGESNTPKDKVKISRAQRDIDAVH